jgi:hypothetical protein
VLDAAARSWRGARVVLRDLGSTNGNFLNGERVEEEVPLESGDRITIGGVEIRYCCVDAGTAVSQAEETRAAASYWPPAGAVASETLRGDLAKVPMFAVLQMLEMGSRAGCLAVETPDGEGWMWLERGRLVHASAPRPAASRRRSCSPRPAWVASTSRPAAPRPSAASAPRSPG